MIDYNDVCVTVDLATLRANHDLLASFLEREVCDPCPIVKADAYGHGLIETATTLLDTEHPPASLAVGSMAEGARLREAFGGQILVMLGLTGEAEAKLAHKAWLTPLVSRVDQLKLLARAGEEPIEVALKFDTGMGRLGFKPEELPEVLETLARHPTLSAVLAVSHLALGDEAGEEAEAYTRAQLARFSPVLSALRKAGHHVVGSIAHSGALIAYPETRLNLVRPGIALYGVNPWKGTDKAFLADGLAPAMEVTAPVLHVHTLRAGESVSYGATYTAERETTVAVVGAGYADNYSRALSGRGQMCLSGLRAPILGRVCMQMTAVDVSRHVAGGISVVPGDRAYLLGGEGQGRVSPEELADWWGTISYEVFLCLGQNPREYVDSNPVDKGEF